MSRRLRLRLPEGESVITTYDRVRDRVDAIMQSGPGERERLIDEYETERDAFLDAGREALERVVATSAAQHVLSTSQRPGLRRGKP